LPPTATRPLSPPPWPITLPYSIPQLASAATTTSAILITDRFLVSTGNA
jgi:hypothetical protein